MIYDLSNKDDLERFKASSNNLTQKGAKVLLEQKRDTRTTRQNKALHLYYTIIANELNELGHEFRYEGLKGGVIELRYTTNIVKEFIWRPIQIALFDIQSTTKINTKQMNEIIDVLSKYFGERGVLINFPSVETLMNENF